MKKVIFIESDAHNEFYSLLKDELLAQHDINLNVLRFVANSSKDLAVNWEGYTGEELRCGGALIDQLESCFDDFRFLRAIENDRFISDSSKWITRLKVLAYRYDQLLKKEKPQLVLGEISTAIEYIFFWLSEFNKVKYRHLLNLPTEPARVSFFRYDHSYDVTQENIETNEAKSNTSYRELVLNVKSYRPGPHKFFRALVNAGYKYDYRKRFTYKLRYLASPIYVLLYSFFELLYGRSLSDLKVPREGKLFYFPLHVQPEATPDYVSINFNNQFDLISTYSSEIRFSDRLIIKEHPVILSFRNLYSWYKLVKKRNIILIKRSESGLSCIKSADYTVSVAGSSAFEAAALGKNAITYSNILYNKHNNVVDGRNSSVADILNQFLESTAKPPSGSFELDRYGYPGFFHNPDIFPGVLEHNNIRLIADAISDFIARNE